MYIDLTFVYASDLISDTRSDSQRRLFDRRTITISYRQIHQYNL